MTTSQHLQSACLFPFSFSLSPSHSHIRPHSNSLSPHPPHPSTARPSTYFPRCSDEPQPLDSELHARRCCRETSRLDQRCDSQSRGLSSSSTLPASPSTEQQQLNLSPRRSARLSSPLLRPSWTASRSRSRSRRFTPICLNCRRFPCGPPTARPRLLLASSVPLPGTPICPPSPSPRATRPPLCSTAPTCTRCRPTESESMFLTRISSLFPFLLQSPCLVCGLYGRSTPHMTLDWLGCFA